MHPQKPYPIDTRLQSCRRSVTRARRRATERGVPAQDARTGEAVVLFPRRVACGSGVVAEEGGGIWSRREPLAERIGCSSALEGCVGRALRRRAGATKRKGCAAGDLLGALTSPSLDGCLGATLGADRDGGTMGWSVGGAVGVRTRGEVNRRWWWAGALLQSRTKVRNSKTLSLIHWPAGN